MQIFIFLICASAGVVMIAKGFYRAWLDEQSTTQPRRIVKTKYYFHKRSRHLFEQPTFYLLFELEVTANLWDLLLANSTENDPRLLDPSYSNLLNPNVDLTWILEDYVLNLNHRLWGEVEIVPDDVDPSLAGSHDPTFKGYCYSCEHYEDIKMSMFKNRAKLTWTTYQKKVHGFWFTSLLLTIDVSKTKFKKKDSQKCQFYMDWKIILPNFYEYLGWSLDGTFFVARDWSPSGLSYHDVKQASIDYPNVKVNPTCCGPLQWDSAVSHDMAQWGGRGSSITMTMTEMFINGKNRIRAQATSQVNGLVSGCQIFTQTRHAVHYWKSFAPYSWWMAISNTGATWSLVTLVFLFFARKISDLKREGKDSVSQSDLGLLVKIDRNEKMRLGIENKLSQVKDKTTVLSSTVRSMKDVKSFWSKKFKRPTFSAGQKIKLGLLGVEFDI
jgi:hypothetical protein